MSLVRVAAVMLRVSCASNPTMRSPGLIRPSIGDVCFKECTAGPSRVVSTTRSKQSNSEITFECDPRINGDNTVRKKQEANTYLLSQGHRGERKRRTNLHVEELHGTSRSFLPFSLEP